MKSELISVQFSPNYSNHTVWFRVQLYPVTVILTVNFNWSYCILSAGKNSWQTVLSSCASMWWQWRAIQENTFSWNLVQDKYWICCDTCSRSSIAGYPAENCCWLGVCVIYFTQKILIKSDTIWAFLRKNLIHLQACWNKFYQQYRTVSF